MMPLLLKGLEATINRLLRMDPESLERTKMLTGKVVKVEISDWNLTFFILPHQDGLELLSSYDGQTHTIISGKLLGLLKAGAAKASTTALFDASITINGDTQTGEALRDVLKHLDIDWEEQLSKVVGDSLAHPLAHQAKKFVQFGKRSMQSLRENITEYLHYESKQLPPKQAVAHFINDVAKLRNDVDRLEARINRLLSKKAAS